MDVQFQSGTGEETAFPRPNPLGRTPQIRRLDESVVNRIAAGEVIQRPVSAVKELVENSLDADSSSVSVIVKDGGLKLIQVSDDGHGIRYDDLPILCERHTTSKLSAYEDLQNIKTMGFRGEALASMTFVAHVTVTTITEGQLHGYRATYKDGVMENSPKACAAVKGTQIMVENLFYNMASRRKNFQNSADDYAKIVDLLSRFAVHHINVNFSCRKHGANKPDVHSVASTSRTDCIRSVYGPSISRNLIDISASSGDASGSIFEMEGLISNSNYIAKKIIMILFINDRLVDCGPLKRAIEVVYAATLPKASKPFVYMSIKLPTENVDVNMHPTKKEVSLLHQEVIVETIQTAISSKLKSSNNEMSFLEQTVDTSPSCLLKLTNGSSATPSSSGSKDKKTSVKSKVRTDTSDPAGRLHSYMPPNLMKNLESEFNLTTMRGIIRQRRNPKETADLSSLQELIDSIDEDCHSGLLDIVKNCTYVGMADDIFALIQHNTALYLANVVNLSKELMYQQSLRRFAHFNAIELSEPAPLKALLTLALKEDETDPLISQNEELTDKIAEMNSELLKQKAEMLEEYFGICIDEQNLCRLPVVLDQHMPEMDRLPDFVLSLSNDVNWGDEKLCFQSVAAAIGNFYAMHPLLMPNPSSGLQFYTKYGNHEGDEGDVDQELLSEAENAWAQRDWSIQHVLFPSIRLFLKPTVSMASNGTFVQVASLEKLYKIFERC